MERFSPKDEEIILKGKEKNIIALLMEKRTPPFYFKNYVTSSGENLLGIAVKRGFVELTRMLLNLDFDPNQKDANDKIAIDYLSVKPYEISAVFNEVPEIDGVIDFDAKFFKKFEPWYQDSPSKSSLLRGLKKRKINWCKLKSKSGMSVMDYISVKQRGDFIPLFVNAGLSVDKVSNKGKTPLWYAVYRNTYPDSIPLLIDNGASLFDKEGNDANSPFHAAIRGCRKPEFGDKGDRKKTFRILLDSFNPLDIKQPNFKCSSPIAFAFELMYTEPSESNKWIFDDFIKKISNSNLTVDDKAAILSVPDKNGNVPLISTARRGDLKYTEKLLDLGANLTDKNVIGINPVIASAMSGNKKCFELLFKAAEAKDVLKDVSESQTIISDLDSTYYDKRFHQGWPLLFYLIAKNYTEQAKKLITNEYGIDKVDAVGNNALMIAIKYNNFELVKELLAKGIEVNVQNVNKETPKTLAQRTNNPRIIKLIEEEYKKPENQGRPKLLKMVEMVDQDVDATSELSDQEVDATVSALEQGVDTSELEAKQAKEEEEKKKAAKLIESKFSEYTPTVRDLPKTKSENTKKVKKNKLTRAPAEDIASYRPIIIEDTFNYLTECKEPYNYQVNDMESEDLSFHLGISKSLSGLSQNLNTFNETLDTSLNSHLTIKYDDLSPELTYEDSPFRAYLGYKFLISEDKKGTKMVLYSCDANSPGHNFINDNDIYGMELVLPNMAPSKVEDFIKSYNLGALLRSADFENSKIAYKDNTEELEAEGKKDVFTKCFNCKYQIYNKKQNTSIADVSSFSKEIKNYHRLLGVKARMLDMEANRDSNTERIPSFVE